MNSLFSTTGGGGIMGIIGSLFGFSGGGLVKGDAWAGMRLAGGRACAWSRHVYV